MDQQMNKTLNWLAMWHNKLSFCKQKLDLVAPGSAFLRGRRSRISGDPADAPLCLSPKIPASLIYMILFSSLFLNGYG